MEKFNCIMPSWQDIHDTAKKTAVLIKQSDFHPEIIIAVARGGLVPARLFCDFLHVKSCYAVKVDHWGLTATKDGQAKLTHELNLDLEGKKVLVVDDITDTGQSMELAKTHISNLKPAEVKTATLIHLNGSKYTPDFFGTEMNWAWIVFPWNYTEDMVNIIRKITKAGQKAVEVIKGELVSGFNVNISNNEIQEVLDHIRYLESQGR